VIKIYRRSDVYMAAITNVKVIESMIEVPAVSAAQYRKVDREAKDGDVIRFNDESDYVTRGGFYEVVRVDNAGDPQILDNDGDEYDLCGDDYEVYKKVTEAAKPESDELFTYEGPDGTSVQYRKVKRKAAVGERILIVKAFGSFGKYKNGDTLVVDRLYASIGIESDAARTRNGANDAGFISHEEYVVLEPVKSAEPPKPTFKVGDTVKLTVADGKKP